MKLAQKGLLILSVVFAIVILFLKVAGFQDLLHSTIWYIFIYHICTTFILFSMALKDKKKSENNPQILLSVMVTHFFFNMIALIGYVWYAHFADLLFIANYFISFLLYTCLLLYGIIANLRPKN